LVIKRKNLLKNPSKVKLLWRLANPKGIQKLVLHIDLTYKTFVTLKTQFVIPENDSFTSHRIGSKTYMEHLHKRPSFASQTTIVRFNPKLWWL